MNVFKVRSNIKNKSYINKMIMHSKYRIGLNKLGKISNLVQIIILMKINSNCFLVKVLMKMLNSTIKILSLFLTLNFYNQAFQNLKEILIKSCNKLYHSKRFFYKKLCAFFKINSKDY